MRTVFKKKDCCDSLIFENQSCYRAQCFQTAKLIAEKLQLPAEKWSVSFQSRLGRTPWIQPFTDLEFIRLAKSGKKRIAVMCPSFVADCLETLEEIGIRGRQSFLENGGEALTLIPCPNDEDAWVEGFAKYLEKFLA